MKNLFSIILLALLVTCHAFTIDIAKKYKSITYETIKSAIREAQAIFEKSPNTVITIKIRSGTHKIKPPSNKPQAILFTGTQPGPGGRLIFEGAGRSNTVLVIPKGFTSIRGRDVYRLTVRHLTFTRDQPLVSQGRVILSGTGFVVLQLPHAFPDVLTIYDAGWTQGRYLKKYKYIKGKCFIEEHNNPQVEYNRIERIGGGKYKFILSGSYSKKNPQWKAGQMIGVKSKCCGKYGRDTYWFCRGGDIVFENLKFMRSSRGTLRCGISNIRFSNILIRKENAGWCLATSGGGPQLGQPDDPPISNVIVDHVVADGTGDDSVALFNVKSGIVRNCVIRDSFARGILLHKSSNVKTYNNKLARNSLLVCTKPPCKEASELNGKR